LATGYWQNDSLTTAKFPPNPHRQDPTDRIYATGDRGYYRPNGEVVVVGRADDELNIRGFRLNPAMVNHTLSQHPAVSSVVTLIRHHPNTNDPQLVAYVLGKPTLADGELRHFLATRLPNYMIPDVIQVVDAMPLTPNGKVDFKRLPMIETQATVNTPPQTETERIIAGIWQHLLDLAQIDIHQNFFTLGGHSLLGTQLIAQLQTKFNINIPLNLIFIAPTISQLSIEIEHLQMEVLEDEDLSALFDMVESLSPEELASL
jgi:acyl carrier protein